MLERDKLLSFYTFYQILLLREALITTLQAVNIILSGLGDTEAETLENPSADIALAISMLNRVTEEIQLTGWHFNREEDYLLIPDKEGIIHIPSDVHRIIFHGNCHRYIKKGNRLYDLEKGSYNIGKHVRADVIRILPFEEMPLTFQHYASVRAARKYQNNTLSSNVIRSFQEQDEAEARFICLKEEQQVSRPTLRPLKYRIKGIPLWA